MENYAAIKERLVAGADVALVGVDDDLMPRDRATRLRARPGAAVDRDLGRRRAVERGICVDGHAIVSRTRRRDAASIDLAGIADAARRAQRARTPPSPCRRARAAALDVEPRSRAALAQLPGPAASHGAGRAASAACCSSTIRKATNADAAEKALLSFDDIYWILGGKAKEGGIEPLRPLFGRVAKAYLIGEAADDFARDARRRRRRTSAAARSTSRSRRRRATRRRAARAEPVVLLSPACASYDQFAEFRERAATAFRALVAERSCVHAVHARSAA